jgi:NMD protein affecting ribosome stability and mRNA decay
MSKSNATPTLSAKLKAPEHHRLKPQQFHRAFHELAGHCYCTNCGAIGFQKRWYFDPVQEQTLRQDKDAEVVLCPGCTRVEQQLYEGEIVLAKSNTSALIGEIIALIKHTEGKCWYKNPIAKIAGVTEEGEILHIQTTTKFLAERIGKKLQKTFNGHLETKRSDEIVRVYWTD